MSEIPTRTVDGAPAVEAEAVPDTAVELLITNHDRGQVVQVALSGEIGASGWAPVQRRLLALVERRQPAELRLDLDGVGGVDRFPAGLNVVAEALAAFGGSLTVEAAEPGPGDA
jgi:hypothetical protein